MILRANLESVTASAFDGETLELAFPPGLIAEIFLGTLSRLRLSRFHRDQINSGGEGESI